MMSDLRESGCVTADTRLMRADTNAEITIGELMESGARDVPVWALDDRLKLMPRTLTHAFSSGTKPVYELALTSGRQITATANHPFLTYDGWMPLGELVPGSRIGSVRHVPPPLNMIGRNDDEVVLLAHLIGEGSFATGQPIRYASTTTPPVHRRWAARHGSGSPVRRTSPPAGSPCCGCPRRYPWRSHRDPIAAWLAETGLIGIRSHEKFIPDWVFGLPKDQVGLFLRNLWATDGSVIYDDLNRLGRSTMPRPAEGWSTM